MSLQNELLTSNSLSDADDGFGSYVPGPGETINPDGTYGADLNWEDSFGPASKHLGVSEEQWKAFIEGVNEVKENMRKWEEGGGNVGRVLQDRSIPNAMRDRLIMRFMNQGMTEDEAFAAALESPQLQELMKNNDFYEQANDALNQLYASVGLDPSAAIDAGSGANHGGGYTVDFNFLTGEVTHNKGDAIHDFGKGLIKGIAAAAFGAGLTSYLTGLGLSQGTASAVSKAVTNIVTGSGGDIGVEDALGLALGPGGEFADVDIGGEIKDAVVDYVTNPDNYGDDNVIVWETTGGTDEIGNPIINIPNYEDFYEEDEEGGGGETSDSASDSSDVTGDPANPADSADPANPADSADVSDSGELGGEDSDTGGDIIARQLHEAILREIDPELRDRLIKEWENLTGEKYSDDFYDNKPFDPDPRDPIGHVWIPGDNAEGGMWWPVYDQAEIPEDGVWVKGSTMPTEPPENETGTADNEGSASGEDPVGWIWDAVEGVWNPIFRDSEIPEGSVVAPTSTKPTTPPVDAEDPADSSDGSSGGAADSESETEVETETVEEGSGGSMTDLETIVGGTSNPEFDPGTGDSTGSADTGGGETGDQEAGGEEGGSTNTGGTGDGTGTGDGSGSGDGTGDGDGSGDGFGLGGPGMLTGTGGAGKAQPKWGELFKYTTLTPYQKKALTPMIDYIKQAKGMMS